jgi:hypothetical protein
VQNYRGLEARRALERAKAAESGLAVEEVDQNLEGLRDAPEASAAMIVESMISGGRLRRSEKLVGRVSQIRAKRREK